MKKEMDRKTLAASAIDYAGQEYDAHHIKSLRRELEGLRGLLDMQGAIVEEQRVRIEQLGDDLKLMTEAVSTRNAYIKKMEREYAIQLKWRDT